MTLQEWFDEAGGMEEEITQDDELRDAIQAYTEAYSELVYVLNKRGHEIEKLCNVEVE